MRQLQADWNRVHITQRTIVFDGLTFSLKSDLCSKLKVSDSKDFDGSQVKESFVSLDKTTVVRSSDEGKWTLESAMSMPLSS